MSAEASAPDTGTPEMRSPAGGPLRHLVRAERVMCMLLLTAILVVLAIQIFYRFVLSSPLTWTDETSRFLLVWLTFMAAGWVTARDEHIAMNLFTGRGSPRTQRTVNYVAAGAPTLAGLCLVVIGVDPIVRSLGTGATATEVPMAVVYAGPLVGGLLICLHGLVNLRRVHRGEDVGGTRVTEHGTIS